MSPEQLAAVQSPVVRPVWLGQILFPGNPVRVNTTERDLFAFGHTWTGAGALVSIDQIRETASLEAVGLKCTLASVPNNLLFSALDDSHFGSVAELYTAFLDDNWQIVGTPILEYRGRVDDTAAQLGRDTGFIEVNLESRFADFLRPRLRRFTADQHLAQYPNDPFFEFVQDVNEGVLVWPSKEFFIS
jgi:hypothetical protein